MDSVLEGQKNVADFLTIPCVNISHLNNHRQYFYRELRQVLGLPKAKDIYYVYKANGDVKKTRIKSITINPDKFDFKIQIKMENDEKLYIHPSYLAQMQQPNFKLNEYIEE